MAWISDPEAWIALATLTLLEIVLGIDNIVFISILSERVEASKRALARQVGLGLAMVTRILLLFSIVWVMRLTSPLFDVLGNEISGRDLILAAGGIFLLWKATIEIHHKLEGPEEARRARGAPSAFAGVIFQIALLDIVFSLDSVITAVGMADDVGVMVTAVIIAVGFMMLSAGRVSAFVSRHPTVKMLALSFLLLIGMSLVAEAFDQHIPKGYIYFAMGFSLFVEALNLRARKTPAEPVHLRPSHIPGEPT
jgi:predicted tellurium resistance membrane protein TerC